MRSRMRRTLLCPPAAVSPYQLVGARGAPRSLRIGGEGGSMSALPPCLHAIDKLPGEFDLVLAGEQRGIAVEGIDQQPLVCFGDRRSPDRIPEMKIHIGGIGLHSPVRHFRNKPEVETPLGVGANAHMVF